jgi:hypothetical protein
MTTIAYAHETATVACDSRASTDSFIVTDECMKMEERPDYIFFLAGATGPMETVWDNYPVEFEDDPGIHGLIFDRNTGIMDVADWDENGKLHTNKLDYNYAVGSGMYHALTAMDLGCTPAEAVEAAIKRDFRSGGKVHTYNLVDFIKEA